MEWTSDTDLTLTVNGVTLEARCWGPPPRSAPTLVLLHEGLGCVALWKGFPQKLAERTGYGVFAYSRQGYGASDPCDLPRPIDYMTREAVDVLPLVLDAIGVQRCVLLGHSDGGSIAALLAGNVQDHRVRGIILIAPHFFVEDVSIQAITAAREAYDTGDLRQRLAFYHRHVDAAFLGWNGAWLDPDFRDWDITEALDYIRVPVLAIQGLDDPYGTRAQVEDLPERVYAPAEIELLPGCGHAPQNQKPEETLGLITDFLARLDRIEAVEVAM